MSLEQELRENLKAAAAALVVPDTKPTPVPTPTPTRGGGLRYALAGAALVLVVAVPLLIWQGGEGGNQPLDVPTTTSSSATDPTSPATTTPSSPTTLPGATGLVTMETITAGDYRLALVARRVETTEPATASVIIQARLLEGGDPVDETTVGDAAGFFWHTVSGSDAVCEFSASPAADGFEVTAQLLLSPSLGCSEEFRFELREGRITAVGESPEDVARRFMAGWTADDRESMVEWASVDAVTQAEALTPPVEPSFIGCEGAAGSLYCTWEDAGRSLVVRVQNQPPVRVIEVFIASDR